MFNFKALTLAVSAGALLIAPTAATAGDFQDEQIRRLDIMLMVTSLRCRMGADDFQPQYRKFTTNHINTLNGAARRLQAGLVKRHGTRGAARALDKISVGMANEYGQGHPWLGCAELKQIATELADSKDPAAVAIAAQELLGTAPISGSRWARR